MSDARSIMIIDNDPRITYLLQRYVEQMGIEDVVLAKNLLANDLPIDRLVVIIFPSIRSLENAQPIVHTLDKDKVDVFVCISAGDETHAVELGADGWILHPLTFEKFSQLVGAENK